MQASPASERFDGQSSRTSELSPQGNGALPHERAPGWVLVTQSRSEFDIYGSHSAATSACRLFRCIEQPRATAHTCVREYEVYSFRGFMIAGDFCSNATNLLKSGECE